MDVVKNIPIRKNGFYIISGGSNELMRITNKDGHGIVKINEIKGCGVWFNDDLDSGDAYTWAGVYKDYIIRKATKKEIEFWNKMIIYYSDPQYEEELVE